MVNKPIFFPLSLFLQVESQLGDKYEKGKLHRILTYTPTILSLSLNLSFSQSRTCKGRLLYYFPIESEEKRERDSWCAWHNDSDVLTGLCPGMFFREGEKAEIQNPDPNAGLWIRTRQGKEVKVRIPKNALAFQIGEVSQVLSGGLLRATPHAVITPVFCFNSFRY